MTVRCHVGTVEATVAYMDLTTLSATQPISMYVQRTTKLRMKLHLQFGEIKKERDSCQTQNRSVICMQVAHEIARVNGPLVPAVGGLGLCQETLYWHRAAVKKSKVHILFVNDSLTSTGACSLRMNFKV
jgi:hypothetical protein